MMIIQKTDQPWLSQNRVKQKSDYAKISPVGIIKEQRPDSGNQATKMRGLYILVVRVGFAEEVRCGHIGQIFTWIMAMYEYGGFS